MTRTEFEKIILDYVQRHPGCKGTELVVGVVDQCQHDLSQFHKMLNILEDMVAEGKLKEEEYLDPFTPYRVKVRYNT